MKIQSMSKEDLGKFMGAIQSSGGSIDKDTFKQLFGQIMPGAPPEVEAGAFEYFSKGEDTIKTKTLAKLFK